MKGTATLLMGPPGTGKTHSITTLLESGLEVFVMITDPGGEETLLDVVRKKKLPIENLHYHYVAPVNVNFSTLIDTAKVVTLSGYEDLSKLKSGLNKNKYQQFIQLLEALNNFPCDRTGETYGAVDDWGPERVLVVDSLTGINKMCKNLILGSKPAGHVGEYGVARRVQEQLINKLVGDLTCFFVLISHITRERNEVTGAMIITASAVTGPYGPLIGVDFSDVVLAERNGSKFTWSTIALNADVKGRALPVGKDLPPTFASIIQVAKLRAKTEKTDDPSTKKEPTT